MLITGRRCPKCYEQGDYRWLSKTKGYDPRMGVFWCKRCQTWFYAILGNKEYDNAKAETVANQAPS